MTWSISTETLARRGHRLLQRVVGRGLDFTAEPASLRRGDRVQVVLTSGVKGDGLEAGLVCTETYAAFMPDADMDVSDSDRTMFDETAYEEWVPIGEEGAVALTVPRDGPYSYEGRRLKLAWRVAVRERRRGVDKMRGHKLQVLP